MYADISGLKAKTLEEITALRGFRVKRYANIVLLLEETQPNAVVYFG